jgi:hypothetical protein
MTPATFPFALCENLRVSGVSAFSLGPSSDVTLGDDHVIAGVTTSGLKSNYFWAHNSPRASMCLPGETTVWIVAHPRLFKVAQLLSPQCEMTIDLMILTVLPDGRLRSIPWNQWSGSPSPRSTTVVDSEFWTSEFSNLKPWFPLQRNLPEWKIC